MIYLHELIYEDQMRDFEVQKSSFARKAQKEVSYDECRSYACEDIARRLTHIQGDMPDIIEIPKEKGFHFIGRVDTSGFEENTPDAYYKAFEERNFVSFSTINRRNISHYEGEIFYVYNLMPEDIVHIFPMDSNTNMYATNESELTIAPSLWLTLRELEEETHHLGTYNQITCKTKRKGEIIKPIGVIEFGEDQTKAKIVAKMFGIKRIIVHPNKNAINYNGDLMYDDKMINSVSKKMAERFNLSVRELFRD